MINKTTVITGGAAGNPRTMGEVGERLAKLRRELTEMDQEMALLHSFAGSTQAILIEQGVRPNRAHEAGIDICGQVKAAREALEGSFHKLGNAIDAIEASRVNQSTPFSWRPVSTR